MKIDFNQVVELEVIARLDFQSICMYKIENLLETPSCNLKFSADEKPCKQSHFNRNFD